MNTTTELDKNGQIEMLVFEIVRQGNNLRLIEYCREITCGDMWALKNLVILESQEEKLKKLFRVKTSYKNKSIKELPEFVKLFNKEAQF